MTTNELKIKFESTYFSNRWGSSESKSGEGSSWQFARYFAANLIHIIEEYNIKSIYDCSCGDWNWMKYISENFIDYTGNDIVPKLIEVNNSRFGVEGRIKFIDGDMVENLKDCFDLIICRHTFEHLDEPYILKSLNAFKSHSKFSLITSMNYSKEHHQLNPDGFSSRQVNLDLDIFKNIIGSPVFKFLDMREEDVESGIYTNVGTFGYLYKFV